MARYKAVAPLLCTLSRSAGRGRKSGANPRHGKAHLQECPRKDTDGGRGEAEKAISDSW